MIWIFFKFAQCPFFCYFFLLFPLFLSATPMWFAMVMMNNVNLLFLWKTLLLTDRFFTWKRVIGTFVYWVEWDIYTNLIALQVFVWIAYILVLYELVVCLIHSYWTSWLRLTSNTKKDNVLHIPEKKLYLA